jgi:thiamine pyrophosphate-dependent acetolactate synthase large subunit-like protein
MKDLVKRYLDSDLSRRQFLAGLGGLGLSATAARSMAASLAPYAGAANAPPAAAPPGAAVDVRGTGGHLFVQQLKAAGVEYVFFNPATADYPIYDALIDEPGIQLIKGIQEGAVVAMADGYARASGKTGVVLVAHIGLPNAMTQMINSWKDQIPLLVAVAGDDQNDAGGDKWQGSDHQDAMVQPITKWFWEAQSVASIPATVRRGLKFASTPPGGPVFVSLPMNLLQATGSAPVWSHEKFDVPMAIRPEAKLVERVARLLLEARNPVLSIGDEITLCGASRQVIELAELLGLPVVGQDGMIGYWSRPFPTQHPLYVGQLLRNLPYPGKPDVLLNLGNRWGEKASPGTTLISIRFDPTSLARTAPVDIGIVSDIRLATEDLIAAIRSLATPGRLKKIAEERTARTSTYTKSMHELRVKLAREQYDHSPISLSRLGFELEAGLDRDTYYVADVDSGKAMEPVMSFGGDGKQYLATGPVILGWGMAAAFGVKLAKPDVPVVSVVGDGSFCFSGPQPLWSQARYEAPVLNIVLNNHSYNNERNRIWAYGGRQFQAGLDMTCYNGNPDIDYAKSAQAFGVDGEVVKLPGDIKAALERGKRATAEGRPYLLDVHIHRDGIGASSTWHSPYSIAGRRTRKV